MAPAGPGGHNIRHRCGVRLGRSPAAEAEMTGRGNGSGRRPGRTAGGFAFAVLVATMSLPPTIHSVGAATTPTVISQCTEAAVRAAVAAGGSYTMGCDGTITMGSSLVVPAGRSVTLDATGHTVVFDGQGRTQLVLVTGGTLDLISVTLQNGLAAGAAATVGVKGRNGAWGADGVTGADFNGTNGKPGVPGGAGGNGGKGGDAHGGAIEVRSGTVQISNVTIRNSDAIGGNGGAGGSGGAGGKGGNGGPGAVQTNPPLGSNPYAGFGGNGAAGGKGAPGGAGGNGGRGLGGAIYNAGTLTVLDSRLVGNSALGGNGGADGYGGPGGAGGSGGTGTGYGPLFLGGAGGNGANAGAGSSAGAAGAGGDGLGGAVFNDSHAHLVVLRTTLTGNTARGASGGASAPGGDGGGGGNGGLTGNNSGAKLGNAGSGANAGNGGAAGPGGKSCGGALNVELAAAVTQTLTLSGNAVVGGSGSVPGTAGRGGLAGTFAVYSDDPTGPNSGKPGKQGANGQAGAAAANGTARAVDLCGPTNGARPRIAGFGFAAAGGAVNENPYQTGYVAPVVWDQAHPFTPNSAPAAIVGDTVDGYDDNQQSALFAGHPAASLDSQNNCPKWQRQDWRSCSAASGKPTANGSPTLDWPVVTAVGTHPSLVTAQVWVPAGMAPTNAYLAGDVTVGTTTVNGALKSKTTFTVAPSNNDVLKTVGEVDFTDNGNVLTSAAGVKRVSIRWCIESIPAPCSAIGSAQIDLGTTTSPVYVLPHPVFALPTSYRPVLPVQPYLTMVELATRGVALSTGDDSTRFDAIYAKFEMQRISRSILNPQTGNVTATETAALQYYPANWTFKGQVTGGYALNRVCRGSDPGASLLQAGVNNCSEWAGFLTEVAAIDGIKSRAFLLATNGAALGNQAMLIGPQAWNGGGLQVGQVDSYVWNPATGANGAYTQTKSQFTYTGAGGQGPNLKSPGWFLAGDHVLVSYNQKVYDPSYGAPAVGQDTTCAAVGCWAKAHLAGLAEVDSPAGSTVSVELPQQCPQVPPPALGLQPFQCAWTVTDVAPWHYWANEAAPSP